MSIKIKATKATIKKYAERINKSQDEIQEDLVETSIAEAKNQLELGTLEVKGQLIKAEAEMKQIKTAIATAQRDLENAKGAMPFKVNEILSCRTKIKKAEIELETKTENYNQIEEAFDYLTDLNAELF